MVIIERIHHVSLPVTNLIRSKQFYSELLGLREIQRPDFDFPGAWYQVGDCQLHLIVHVNPTLRTSKAVDSRDIHFAIRVKSYEETREFLRSKGYHPDAENRLMKMKENPKGIAGFPQLYIMDPDRNVIEFNAQQLDGV